VVEVEVGFLNAAMSIFMGASCCSILDWAMSDLFRFCCLIFRCCQPSLVVGSEWVVLSCSWGNKVCFVNLGHLWRGEFIIILCLPGQYCQSEYKFLC